ncbi:MAG: Hpt domain-containing protein [Anaeroplasma sp.]
MDIKDCYKKMGGSFEDIFSRLPKESLIEKFLFKFIDDESYDLLFKYMSLNNKNEAFKACHTLKGVCANLGFSLLLESCVRLTDELRTEADDISAYAYELFEDVKEKYKKTIDAIREYYDVVSSK